MNTIIQITTSDREQLLELWGRLPDTEVSASVTEDGDVLLAIDYATESQPQPVPVAPTVLASKPTRARRTGPTCGQAIVAFLDQEPEIVFTTEQVAAALAGAFKESTVKFTLSEITRAGDITRVRPGLFQAKAAA
jgi:hypothetical protein